MDIDQSASELKDYRDCGADCSTCHKLYILHVVRSRKRQMLSHMLGNFQVATAFIKLTGNQVFEHVKNG